MSRMRRARSQLTDPSTEISVSGWPCSSRKRRAGSDLVEDAVDELRSGETGLDEHQDHPFDLVEIGRQRLDRRGGIHHQSEMRSARPDGFRQLVQLFPQFDVQRNPVAGTDVHRLHDREGVFDHQVDVERQLRYAVHRRDEIDART